MKHVNHLFPNGLNEYRLDIVHQAKGNFPFFAYQSDEMLVYNAEFFSVIWLDEASRSWSGYPDLYDIFKPYGADVYNAIRRQIEDEISSGKYKILKSVIARGKKSIFLCDEEIFINLFVSNKKEELYSPKLRWQILERDGYKCVRCGRTAEDGIKLHVDHIYPRSKGGMATLENGQTLCNECNIGKGARVPLMQAVDASA